MVHKCNCIKAILFKLSPTCKSIANINLKLSDVSRNKLETELKNYSFVLLFNSKVNSRFRNEMKVTFTCLKDIFDLSRK
jgi:hypothetical protein